MGLKIPLFSLRFGRLFFHSSFVVSEKACEQCFNTYRHRFPSLLEERKLSNNLTQAVTSNVNLWSANSLVFVPEEFVRITRRALPLVTKYLGDLSVPLRPATSCQVFLAGDFIIGLMGRGARRAKKKTRNDIRFRKYYAISKNSFGFWTTLCGGEEAESNKKDFSSVFAGEWEIAGIFSERSSVHSWMTRDM